VVIATMDNLLASWDTAKADPQTFVSGNWL
jgi:hypothetical protein